MLRGVVISTAFGQSSREKPRKSQPIDWKLKEERNQSLTAHPFSCHIWIVPSYISHSMLQQLGDKSSASVEKNALKKWGSLPHSFVLELGFFLSNCQGKWRFQFWMFLPELLEKFHLLFFSSFSWPRSSHPTICQPSNPIPSEDLYQVSLVGQQFVKLRCIPRHIVHLPKPHGFLRIFGSRVLPCFFWKQRDQGLWLSKILEKKNRCSNYQLGSWSSPHGRHQCRIYSCNKQKKIAQKPCNQRPESRTQLLIGSSDHLASANSGLANSTDIFVPMWMQWMCEAALYTKNEKAFFDVTQGPHHVLFSSHPATQQE